MRKSTLGFVLMAWMTMTITIGCKDKKPEIEKPDEVDTVAPADTVDSIVVDTIPANDMDSLISATPMPESADELFDDFLFNFTANKKLQYERVKFPLKVIDGDSETALQMRDWQHERYFRDQEFYTLILDDEDQLELLKDTSIDSVVQRPWSNMCSTGKTDNGCSRPSTAIRCSRIPTNRFSLFMRSSPPILFSKYRAWLSLSPPHSLTLMMTTV